MQCLAYNWSHIVTEIAHGIARLNSASALHQGHTSSSNQIGGARMKIMGVELAEPPLERTIRGARWLLSTLLVLAVITAVTGGNMHDVPKAGLQWLPMVALWTWGWDPFKQGPPAWILGVFAWIGSTVLTALVIHYFVR